MFLRTSVLLAALSGLAGVAEAATPALFGTYTMSGSEYCRYAAGRTIDHGWVDMRAIKAVFATTATGKTVTVSGTSFGGSLFPVTPDVAVRSKSGTYPYRITAIGSGNPYKMTLGSGASARAFLVHFSEVDARGIAHHAKTLESDTNAAGKIICTRAMTLQRH